MKNFRNSFLIKPVSILLAILTLNLGLYSCKKDNDSNSNSSNNNVHKPSQTVYSGQVAEMVTDNLGRHDLSTQISSQGEDFNLTYEFKVVDQSGNPIEGMKITYNQIGGKSLIYVTDEQERYASTFFIGTPRDLETYFNGKTEAIGPYSGELGESPSNYKESEFLITLTVFAVITVLAIGAAEVGFILNAYKVQEFYLTDYVSETEDYILYCKTFEEIAELMKARTGMVLNLTSIFVSYVSLGAGAGPSVAFELEKSISQAAIETLRTELLNQAIDSWGMSMDELTGHKVAVKVFPYEEDESYSGARNLFATYTIEYDNELCSGEGVISGVVTDAETGYPIQNAMITLSGDDNSTDLTNSQGKYSFEVLEAGDYTITAEKSDYITEFKNVQFDGSAAEVNFVLSKTIGNDEYRVVLTWGEFPEDMDIHLFTEDGTHIYYGQQGSLVSYPYIYLDVDDLYSFGPETITIAQLQSASIYVNNFSQYPDIKQSEAEIKVYNGNSLIKQYDVPSSGYGLWWYVFDIDSFGDITDVDYLMDQNKVYAPKK